MASSTPNVTLDLQHLRKGIPTLTSELGGVLAQAAAVCLKYQNHKTTVKLSVRAADHCEYVLKRPGVTARMERAYADPRNAAELGACGIAILLIRKVTKYTAVRKSFIGTGFDYWLATNEEVERYAFQGSARLEVSGMMSATDTQFSSRVKQKKEQTKASDDMGLPAFVIVIEIQPPASSGGGAMTSPQVVNAWHDEAMAIAEKAVVAEMQGRYAKADKFFLQAYELEAKAAKAMIDKTDVEPTRSILLRSAASLALQCRNYRDAEILVGHALTGNPPAFAVEELHDVLERVRFSRNLNKRGLELDYGEFQMLLKGSAIGPGVAPGDLVLKRTEAVDNLLVRTAERLRKMPFRETGAPGKGMEDFVVYLTVPSSGSFAVAARMGRPQRQLLLPGFVGPNKVVDEALNCFALFNAEDRDKLQERIGDEAYFNNFTALAKKLSPDGHRVTAVVFASVYGDNRRQIILGKPPSQVWTPPVSEEHQFKRIIGWLGFGDELTNPKRPRFRIEDEEGEKHEIEVSPGMLQDIVKPLWGVRVLVTVRCQGKHCELLEIKEMVEEEAANYKSSPEAEEDATPSV